MRRGPEPCPLRARGPLAQKGTEMIEEWRPVQGWPYEVSNLGRVRRSGRSHLKTQGRVMKNVSRPDGYKLVRFRDRGRSLYPRVNRLVAIAFHGPPPAGRNDCRHLDGRPANNRADNLAWGSRAENMADAKRHGTLRPFVGIGEKNPRAVLTESKVRKIRRSSKRHSELAKMFGVTATTISHIRIRRLWKHVA